MQIWIQKQKYATAAEGFAAGIEALTMALADIRDTLGDLSATGQVFGGQVAEEWKSGYTAFAQEVGSRIQPQIDSLQEDLTTAIEQVNLAHDQAMSSVGRVKSIETGGFSGASLADVQAAAYPASEATASNSTIIKGLLG